VQGAKMIKFELDPKKVAELVLWMEEYRQKHLHRLPRPRCKKVYKDTGELRNSIAPDSLKNKTDSKDGGKDGKI
jgi:hypothetical protein